MNCRNLRALLKATLFILVLSQIAIHVSAARSARSVSNLPAGSAVMRYRLDASQSKFIAHALRGGLLWFKGHDHLVAARDFSEEAEITRDSVNPASLLLNVKTDSMVETSSVFTDQQKQIINKELRENCSATGAIP